MPRNYKIQVRSRRRDKDFDKPYTEVANKLTEKEAISIAAIIRRTSEVAHINWILDIQFGIS